MYNNNLYNNPYLAAPGYSPYSTGPAARQQVIRVNGQNGAQAYQLAPSSSALLLDESAPIVWLVQSDGAGYKTCTPYSIAPYKPEQPVDTKALEARITRLEEIINEQSDAKSVRKITTVKSESNKTNG